MQHTEGTLICDFCLVSKKSNNSRIQHQIRCSKNPNKLFVGSHKKGKKGGNAFTAGTKIGHSIETREKMKVTNKRVHTQETKAKISSRRKKYLDENPDKVPYLLNHSSKQSYPEKYFQEIFENFLDATFEYSLLRYHIDVAFPSRKVALEIDGEQHYVDKRVVASDIIRDQTLSDLGWSTIRIRWSNYSKLSLEDREQYVLLLKHSIENQV